MFEHSSELALHLTSILNDTMNPDLAKRQGAERQLTQMAEFVDRQDGLCRALLAISVQSTLPNPTRHAAAIFFKNVVRNHWDPAIHDHVVMNPEKEFIRKNILVVMLSSPVFLQKTLGEAINIICDLDFPKEWSQLIDDIANHLSDPTATAPVICGTLSTAHSVFSRYQNAMELNASNFDELQLINKRIIPPLIVVLEKAIQVSDFEISMRCTEVFHDICYLDFGDEVEATLGRWMSAFLMLVKLPMSTGTDWELIAELKGVVVNTLAHFLTKYDSEFTPFLHAFIEAIWELLCKLTSDPKDDAIAIAAMDFIAAGMRGMHNTVFKDENMLNVICEKIVFVNVTVRDSDLEMFEEDPVEYIQRDIEGSDVHTRRRAACELAHALICDHFGEAGVRLLSNFIALKYAEALANPGLSWKTMDAVLYLVMQLASRSQLGALAGNKGLVRELLPLGKVYKEYIVREICDANVQHIVLKADAIKFMCCFRQQIPKEQMLEILPSLVNWIKVDNDVVVSYTAHVIDRLMDPKEGIFSKADVQPVAVPLTFAFIERLGTLSEPNERLARALFRVIRVAGDHLNGIVAPVATALHSHVTLLVKNPQNPIHNHNIFEAVGSLIQNLSPPHVSSLEELFWPTLTNVLATDMSLFMPYVFQLMALLVQHSEHVSPRLTDLFVPLLTPHLYEDRRNVPSLVYLLRAFIQKCGAQLHTAGHTTTLLSVFQQLVSSKATDDYAFQLLSTMTTCFPADVLVNFVPTLLQHFFSRLTHGKTTKFVRCLILYLSLFVVKVDNGAELLLNEAERLQAGIAANLLENIWIPHVAKVMGANERKLCIVALTELIVRSTIIKYGGKYVHMWKDIVCTICRLHFLGHDEETINQTLSGSLKCQEYNLTDENLVNGTALLNCCTEIRSLDPIPNITDPWAYFTREIGSLLQSAQSGFYIERLRALPVQPLQCLKEIFPMI